MCDAVKVLKKKSVTFFKKKCDEILKFWKCVTFFPKTLQKCDVFWNLLTCDENPKTGGFFLFCCWMDGYAPASPPLWRQKMAQKHGLHTGIYWNRNSYNSGPQEIFYKTVSSFSFEPQNFIKFALPPWTVVSAPVLGPCPIACKILKHQLSNKHTLI